MRSLRNLSLLVEIGNPPTKGIPFPTHRTLDERSDLGYERIIMLIHNILFSSLQFLLVVLLAATGTHALAQKQSEAPNVILVLVDDMGWMDLSCQGSDFCGPQTSIGSRGRSSIHQWLRSLRRMLAHRAAVQTGRYPHRLGVTDWIRSLFQRGGLGTPEKNPTEYVREEKIENYSAHPIPIGWKVRKSPLRSSPGKRIPDCLYWEMAFGGTSHGIPKSRVTMKISGLRLWATPFLLRSLQQPQAQAPHHSRGYPQTAWKKEGRIPDSPRGDEAVALIREWKDQPFFIQVSRYAVHTPIQAIQEVADQYKFKEGMSETNRKYAAMVESIDDCMRDMLAELKKHGIDENTMIIFTSDNGGLTEREIYRKRSFAAEKDTATKVASGRALSDTSAAAVPPGVVSDEPSPRSICSPAFLRLPELNSPRTDPSTAYL